MTINFEQLYRKRMEIIYWYGWVFVEGGDNWRQSQGDLTPTVVGLKEDYECDLSQSARSK